MSGPQVTGAHVKTNGIRLHYLRYGCRGAPLVMLPGITSPAITWGFVAERLAERFDVYVLDTRGRGLSSTGPHLDYGLTTLAEDLIGFVTAMDLSDVTVLGHSMGARIAVRAAVKNASGLKQVVLVDPPVSGPGRRPYPAKLAWYVDSIRQANAGMSAADMLAFYPTWTEAQRALRAEWLHTCYEPAILAAFDGFHTDDFHRDLQHLSVPVALMVAGSGGVIEAADEAEMRSLNPRMRIARVPDAGHMIPWDDFNGFFTALDELLDHT